MSNGFGTVTFCALLIAICMSSETAADNRNRHVIDGFAGIEFGSKVDRYSDAGSSKVVDTGRRAVRVAKAYSSSDRLSGPQELLRPVQPSRQVDLSRARRMEIAVRREMQGDDRTSITLSAEGIPRPSVRY